jgi:hypothetical protein
MDDAKAFGGTLDRFNFKLLGKQEKYIVYNAFGFQDNKRCPAAVLLTKNFPNPACTRYELHRVWVVEATLKPGFRHIYPKRLFYWDEDTANAGESANYDAGGKLFRTAIAMWAPYYDGAGGTPLGEYAIDMQTGGWSNEGAGTCPTCGMYNTTPKPADYYSPEALGGSGIR